MSNNFRFSTCAFSTGRQYKLRAEGKPSNMTPFRIRELEALGFEWELRTYKKVNAC
jgi:hypothetical protein